MKKFSAKNSSGDDDLQPKIETKSSNSSSSSGSSSRRPADAQYLFIGCGAAACVTASKLLLAGKKVLIIEQGPDISPQSTDPFVQDDKINVQIPLRVVYLGNNYNRVPGSNNCGSWEATDSMLDFQAPNENGVPASYIRGGGPCGSGGHHYMQDGAGSMEIYDLIAKKIKDKRWKGKYMHKYFMDMESHEQSAAHPDVYGSQGWLKVKQSQPDWLHTKIWDAAIASGRVERSETPEFTGGIGKANVQVSQNGRSNSFLDLLNVIRQNPQYASNIEIRWNTSVDEIVFEKRHGKLVAVGVKCYEGRALAGFQISGDVTYVPYGNDCAVIRPDRPLPSPTYFYADHVILSAGPIQGPTILMRSGVGPEEHLKSHGIDCKLDVPGVGQDIIDHHEVGCVYEFDPTKWISRYQADFYYYIQTPGGPLINLVPPGPFRDRIVEQHAASQFSSFFGNTSSLQMELRTKIPGPLKNADVHNVLYDFFVINLNTVSSSGDQPHDPADIHHGNPRKDLVPNPANPFDQTGIPGKQDLVQGGYANPANPRVFMTWLTECLMPGTGKHVERGSIQLRDRDFRSEPLIQLNYWKDDEAISRLVAAIKIQREIMNRPEIKQYAKDPNAFEMYPGPKVRTDEEIALYIKNWSSFGHHMSGGCQMGTREDKNAVVDSNLRFHGIENLMVIDTSVYPPPYLHGYNTVRAAYLIGSVGADIILGQFGKRFH